MKNKDINPPGEEGTMHPGFEKDYRYLLSRLIPRHLLSSERLAGIQHALETGSRLDMVREAFRSMEELTSRGIFRKEGMKRLGDSISVSYTKITHPTRISLVMTKPEWDDISGGPVEVGGIIPSVLAGIISSLSLNDSSKAVVDKIEEILGLTGKILTGAEGYLVLLQEPPFPADRSGDRTKVTTWSELSTNQFYRSCLTSGLSHTFVHLSGVFPGESFFDVKSETESIVLIPIIMRTTKWGILEVHFGSESPPDRSTLFNFNLLGQGIIRLLENNRHLEDMVSIDRLTQVHNRNYYETQLPLEMERATRNKKFLAFLMIDIDDFKQINDRYGHDMGDHVLRVIAQNVKNHLRKIDLLFRYGGEEFIVLLPGAGREAAERTAERIREVVSVSGSPLVPGNEMKVTISIGGCIYPTDAQNEVELFRRADQALYISKRKGKDRVTFYED